MDESTAKHQYDEMYRLTRQAWKERNSAARLVAFSASKGRISEKHTRQFRKWTAIWEERHERTNEKLDRLREIRRG